MKKEDILNLASLSRLELTEEEIEKFPEQFESILKFVDQIKDVDTSDVEIRDFSLTNVTRDDSEGVYQKGKNREEVIGQMPDTKDGYLKVKKILNN